MIQYLDLSMISACPVHNNDKLLLVIALVNEALLSKLQSGVISLLENHHNQISSFQITTIYNANQLVFHVFQLLS